MATNPHCIEFPDNDFFEQHPLPAKSLPQPYDDVRCFLLFCSAPVGAVFMDELTFDMLPVKFPGFPMTREGQTEGILKQQIAPVSLQGNSLSASVATPLLPGVQILSTPWDFSLTKPSVVIIRLVGSFWRLSQRMKSITTKHPLGDHYHTSRRHRLIGSAVEDIEDKGSAVEHRCVSFFAGEPCPENHLGPGKHVRHGFSLNIEFVVGGSRSILPATFDPDIENKGGNP